MQHFMSVDIVNKLGHLNSHLTTKKGVEAIQSNRGEKTFDGLTLSSPIYLVIFHPRILSGHILNFSTLLFSSAEHLSVRPYIVFFATQCGVRMVIRNSAPPPLAPLISYFSFMSSPILARRRFCLALTYKMYLFKTLVFHVAKIQVFKRI